ncbi:hypothetical protein [Paenibacillus phytorum]|uniref:hypothetical protein n=1 Tax=Paenibacillus phytorum TaxID=2654977 RepID=UPI0028AD794F|nr:hypothetical protein [Paenibacillus phytorum]
MPNSSKMETRCLSSLVKVFPDQELSEPRFERGSALLNETYSFQVAFRATQEISRALKNVQVQIISGLGDMVSVRVVGLVPSEMPIYGDHDDGILRNTPGLYPDPLFPIDAASGITVLPHQWRSVWITVEPVEPVSDGFYPIRVLFIDQLGEMLAEENFELELMLLIFQSRL